MKEIDKKLDMEKLANKVGGKFKLTTLIQKRIRQLSTQRMFGRRKSDTETINEVLQEIAEGKISLVEENTTGSEEEKLTL